MTAEEFYNKGIDWLYKGNKGSRKQELIEFAEAYLKQEVEAITDDNYIEDYIKWRNKYFDLKPKIYHYKSKYHKTMHTLENLHKDYERAMKESPFKNKLLKQ